MQLSLQDCEPPYPIDNLTDRLNTLLGSSGPGYTLPLCPSAQYILTAPLRFTAPNQEISTVSYPSGPARATLIVNGTNQTTAVDGKCANCDGVKLRYVQIDGARRGALRLAGGANVEMGGSNADQLIEYVHSFDPRGWSCLHVAEGNLSCSNVTVQNNDIGPAGSELFRQWADGISIACRNSSVRNNMVNNPTDGGIVLFGSPGTRVENNTIWVETQTLLGGVNMVDVNPFGGDYDNVLVANNVLAGGFASQAAPTSQIKGANIHNAIIKVGIAIGPRIWFGSRYPNGTSTGGTVRDNRLTGAFGYGIAMSSATDFTVNDNVLVGNTSFIGVRGQHCAMKAIPSPAAFVLDPNNVQTSTTQSDFVSVADANGLVECVVPPDSGDGWPFGQVTGGTISVSVNVKPFRYQAALGKLHHHRLALTLAVLTATVIVFQFVWEWVMRQRAARSAAGMPKRI